MPKTYLPNYGEFYEQRWFAPAAEVLEAGSDARPFALATAIWLAWLSQLAAEGQAPQAPSPQQAPYGQQPWEQPYGQSPYGQPQYAPPPG